MNKKKKKSSVLKIVAAAYLLIAAAAALILWFSGRYFASTMRLERMEGTVRLEDEKGKEQETAGGMRFRSGNTLRTGSSSLASISLDRSKLITLDEKSRADFLKRWRYLELKLTEGRLFFDVSKPLSEKEQFDIRTSTMAMGIRGTSGYVTVDENGRESLTVTDGTVHVTGRNPVTGEVKEEDVSAGQTITVYLFNDRKADSIEFRLTETAEKDLPRFTLRLLAEDDRLMERVCADTGWSPELIRYYYFGGDGTVPEETLPAETAAAGTAQADTQTAAETASSAEETGVSEADTSPAAETSPSAETSSASAVRTTEARTTAARTTAAETQPAETQPAAAEIQPAAGETQAAETETRAAEAETRATETETQPPAEQYMDAEGNPLDDDEIGPWLDYPEETEAETQTEAERQTEAEKQTEAEAQPAAQTEKTDNGAGADAAAGADAGQQYDNADGSDTTNP